MTACDSDAINDSKVQEILAHLEDKDDLVTKTELEKITVRDAERLKPSIEELPTLELKQLPYYLEYAFLEENSELPVIIAAGLTSAQREKLLKILKEHKSALA